MEKNSSIKIAVSLLVFLLLFVFAGSLSVSAQTVDGEGEEIPTSTETTSESTTESAVPTDIEFPYNTTVVRSRDYLGFDNKLSEYLLDDYKEVKEIHVIYISAPTSDIQSDGDTWVKGLYYYLITKKNFPDVPFNFVVTHDGFAYSGKYGASDVQPFAVKEKNDKGKVVIAYMGIGDNFNLEYAGEQKLKDILGYLSAYYRVDSKNIFASDWSIESSEDVATASSITLKELATGSRWQSKLKEVIDSGLPKYSSFSRTYEAKKGQVIADTESEIGGKITVVAEYTNTGKFPWYKSSADQLILYVKGREKSDFFVNKGWLSNEAVGTMSADWVLPGQTAKFSFEMAVPYVADTYTETFELGTLSGATVKDTQITVSFKAVGGSKSLVEILPTGYDYLNVREKASSFSKIIGTVVPGKRYLLVQETPGYYKIRLNDGTEGWVIRKYAKIVK